MTRKNWESDPRIRQLNPEKIAYLNEFAQRISMLPPGQILPSILAMQLDANRKHIRFSDEETECILSVLSEGMSPDEKKRLETLRALARKMAVRKS